MNCSSRHVFSAFEDAAGAVVGLAHFALFLFRERKDAQGKDLVDLCGVEEISCAFRGYLRMVVKDDRGGQHRICSISRQDRPGAEILALGSGS